MKKMMIAFAAVALSALAFMPAQVLTIGSPMPDVANISLQDVSGKQVTLKQLTTGNGLLVMFSCNTCPYVIKNQARTKEILSYAQQQQIGVAVLNPNEAYRSKDDSFDAMVTYAKAQGYNWAYAIDKNHVIADAFGATRTPECFLFDSKGILVYHGAIDDSPSDADAVSRKHLENAIQELKKGAAISVPTSKSIGCSIKRLSN